MEKHYNIFIATAKELTEERACVKEVVSTLNTQYAERGIRISAKCYEDFEDNQPAYNQFIAEKADLVLFILDGRMGKYTEQEFLLTQKLFIEHGRPTSFIFMHKYDSLTPEIARVEGLLTASGEKYYIEYRNLDELRDKISQRISSFVENEESQRVRRVVARTRPHFRRTFIAIMAIAVLTVLCGLSYEHFRQPKLIFAGGGSVKNFLNTKHEHIVTCGNKFYLNLASGASWTLLAEQASRYAVGSKNNKATFDLICLSAGAIDSTFLAEFHSRISEKGQIVELYLGEDTLAVYVQDSKRAACLLDTLIPSHQDDVITNLELADIIRYGIRNPTDVSLFSTSKKSGTLRMFQECLPVNDSLRLDTLIEQSRISVYYETSDLETFYSKINNRPFIILGSDNYFPKDLQNTPNNNLHHRYHVMDAATHVIMSKPLYLYFIAYKERDENNKVTKFTIRRPIQKFLFNICVDTLVNSTIFEEIKLRELHFEDEPILHLNQR